MRLRISLARRLTAVRTAMPTFKYEAMDTTGREVKDSIDAVERGRSPAEDPPDGLLRHQAHRDGGRRQDGGKKKKKAGKKQQDLHHRRRLAQAARAPSPASSRRCRTPACRCSAALTILEGQMKPGVLKNALIDVVEDIEIGQHALRGVRQAPQGVRPALREHDQGRRGRRCPRSHPPAPGRLQGEGPDPQAPRSSAPWSTRSSSSSSPSPS